MIRDRMTADKAFEALHRDTIEAGDLLDDPTAIDLFDGKLMELRKEGPYDVMFVDGFGRTVPQVEHADNLGLLRRHDRAYIVEASHDVCSRRFTNRNENDPGRLEREMKTFTKRYHLHADNVENLKLALRATDVIDNITEIDALNRDRKGRIINDGDPNVGITEYAFPALLSDLIPVISEILAKRVSELKAAEVNAV